MLALHINICTCIYNINCHCIYFTLFVHSYTYQKRTNEIQEKKNVFITFVDMQYAYTVKFTDEIIVYIRHHNKTVISYLF